MQNRASIFKDSDHFLAFCKTHKRLSKDSIRAYYYDLKRFNQFLINHNPPVHNYNEVTKNILEDYLMILGKYQVKTIRRKLAGIRSLFSYLEYQELIELNPFTKFKLHIRDAHKMRESMTIEEALSILKAVYENNTSNDFIGLRDIAVLELLFAGGMRVSELCKIEFQDICMDTMSITLHGKGNKERKVYLENKEVIHALEKYLVWRNSAKLDSPYVFVTRLGGMLSTQAVRNLVTKYCKMAKINKNITPHIFRHTFATLLLEEGVDIKYIQDLLGHSSISTTQLYLHTTENKKRNIIATKHPREQMLIETLKTKAPEMGLN